jgi:creatinine amidohydrolase
MIIISEYDLIMELVRPELETADDSHAGELETSRIMHLAPELVKGTSPEEYPSLSPYTIEADKRSRWPGSVWGNPAAADREKGRLFLERSAQAICEIINQKSGLESE